MSINTFELDLDIGIEIIEESVTIDLVNQLFLGFLMMSLVLATWYFGPINLGPLQHLLEVLICVNLFMIQHLNQPI